MQDVSKYTEKQRFLINWSWIKVPTPRKKSQKVANNTAIFSKFNPLNRLRSWLDQIQMNNAEFAHFLCKNIPAQCPFERDVKIGKFTLFHIPPLCKLNPFYEELVSLRFRALCYLADECGLDISAYC
jgi:hypothetical protein